MNFRRLGMVWERESRIFLKERFDTDLIFKLINPEQIDWLVFFSNNSAKKIAIVESKFTKKPKYYPFESEKKRNQLKTYFSTLKKMGLLGFECEFYLLIKRGKEKKIFFENISSLDDIKRSY